MTDLQEIKVAVLEREVFMLREQLEKHKGEDREMFKNIWTELRDGLDAVQKDLREIFAFINNSKGRDAIRMALASGTGGLIVAVVPWVLTHLSH